MNILSSTVSYQPDSFAPVITLTLEVPLLVMNEPSVIVSEQERAMIIGTEFVAAWKRHMGAVGENV
jgi:hypothetical protein